MLQKQEQEQEQEQKQKNIYSFFTTSNLKNKTPEATEAKLEQIMIEDPKTPQLSKELFQGAADIFSFRSKKVIQDWVAAQDKLSMQETLLALQRDATIDREIFAEILAKLAPSKNQLSIVTTEAIKLNKPEALHGIAQWSDQPLKTLTFDLGPLCEDPIEYATGIEANSELIDIIKTINAEVAEKNPRWFSLPCSIL